MTRRSWTAHYTLKQLLWLALAGALVAGLSLPVSELFPIQNPPQTFWPRVYVLLPRLSTFAVLLGVGIWLIGSATSAIRHGVDESRWNTGHLESLRHTVKRTDWPIFLVLFVSLFIGGFLTQYRFDWLSFLAFVLMRAHTSVWQSLYGSSTSPRRLQDSVAYLRGHRLGTLARAKTI